MPLRTFQKKSWALPSRDQGESLKRGGFKLRWLVSHNNTVVKEGISNGVAEDFWSDKKGRLLGLFPANAGETYRIDLNPLEDGSSLQPYNPRIPVKVDLFALDGYAIEHGFSQLAASALAGIGLLLTAPAVLNRILFFIRSRRTGPPG